MIAASPTLTMFVWTQVRQALQHVVAIGALSPYLAAASVRRPVQMVFTAVSYAGRRRAELLARPS
jgi:hypothetical protein